VKEQPNRYRIRVLDRAFRLLGLLSDGNPRTLTAISQDLGMSNSTVFRLLATLEEHGFVQRDGNTGKYRLGLSCLELSRAYYDGNDIRRNALPELEALRDRTSETVHLGVMDNMEVVYLEKLHGHHAIGLMTSRVGGRAPAYCTGLGKAILAHISPEEVRAYYLQRGLKSFTERTIKSVDDLLEHLEEVRRQGYAFDRGEHEHEVRCVAAPIFDISGKPVAAISVSGPAARLEPIDRQQEIIRMTVEAARTISRRLGYRAAEA
jgi:IclR family acetate operon transcriptional repressor